MFGEESRRGWSAWEPPRGAGPEKEGAEPQERSELRTEKGKFREKGEDAYLVKKEYVRSRYRGLLSEGLPLTCLELLTKNLTSEELKGKGRIY